MANYYSATHRDPSWDGQPASGGATVKWMQSTFTALTNGLTSGAITFVGSVPAGSVVTGVRYVNADLGTGSLHVGTKTKSTVGDSATKFFTSINVGSAGSGTWAGTPLKITEFTDIIITSATQTGTLSGQVDIVLDYVYMGTGDVGKISAV